MPKADDYNWAPRPTSDYDQAVYRDWERSMQARKLQQLDEIIEKLDRLIVLVEKLVPDAEDR